MKKCYRKLISFLLIAIMTLCSIPPISAKAATEEVKAALRQAMLDLIFDGSDKKVSIRHYNLTFDEYKEVWNDVFYNEPSIRVIRECYSSFHFGADKDGQYMNNLSLTFPEENLKERYEKIQAVLDQIHSDMEGMKDIEKVLYTYDYIIQHTTYNLDAEYRSVASGPLLEGEAVCAGYADAMLLILELEGIECKAVYNSSPKPTHEWVAVKLDGEWYQVDPTWGDTRSRQKPKTDYRFLLCTDTDFLTAGDTNHGGIVDTPIATSTKYSSWYVHDIVGSMLYDAGYWYYMKDGSIVKNNIEGTAYEVVVEGTNLELISVENGVLTYKENGVQNTKVVYEQPAHTHTVVEDKAVEATCSQEGKTAGSHCSECGEVIVAQQTIEKKSHTEVTDPEVPATTESEGKTAGSHCSVCGEVIVAQEVIPKLSADTDKDADTDKNQDTDIKTGWVQDGENWYYFNAEGIKQTGWVQVGTNWYYLNSEGIMQTGWVQVGNNWYYLNSNGTMRTGWLKEGNNWYYLGSSGVMVTGWFKEGTKWYYMNGSGIMQVGWVKVGGTWYYLGNAGSMLTGWFKQSNIWYYLSDSGAMLNGWQQIKGKWYYFYSSGKMAANTKIGSYFVNSNGEWIK